MVSACVTRINTLSEPAYMLTVQNIQDYMNYWIDLFADEHPEAEVRRRVIPKRYRQRTMWNSCGLATASRTAISYTADRTNAWICRDGSIGGKGYEADSG